MVSKSTALRIFVDGAQVTMDYLTAVSLGYFPTRISFRAIGRRSALATTVGGDDLWEGAVVTVPFPDQSIGEHMTLVSTSANDTAAGSGVQQVDVHHINAAGLEVVETVTMNGTTPVNTVATNIRFVQYIHTRRVGALGATAAGDITIYRTGDATRVYNVIKTGGNISLSAHRMVPSGKTFYMTNIKADAVDNKPVSVRLRATCDYEGVLTQNVFIFNETFELYNSSQAVLLPILRKFPAFCIIKASAISTTAGGTASLGYEGWIE
jgi:hypothetical protein